MKTNRRIFLWCVYLLTLTLLVGCARVQKSDPSTDSSDSVPQVTTEATRNENGDATRNTVEETTQPDKEDPTEETTQPDKEDPTEETTQPDEEDPTEETTQPPAQDTEDSEDAPAYTGPIYLPPIPG